MIAEMSPELKKAAGIMKAYSELDPKTRREYELLMLAEMDDRVRLRAAKKEGRAEGMAEGMAQGMVQGNAQGMAKAARAMKAEGLDPATVARITGLTPDDIRRL